MKGKMTECKKVPSQQEGRIYSSMNNLSVGEHLVGNVVVKHFCPRPFYKENVSELAYL